MLKLTRRPGEKIHIGPDIVVEVRYVTSGGQVHLAVYAPRDVTVLRDELIEEDDSLLLATGG